MISAAVAAQQWRSFLRFLQPLSIGHTVAILFYEEGGKRVELSKLVTSDISNTSAEPLTPAGLLRFQGRVLENPSREASVLVGSFGWVCFSRSYFLFNFFLSEQSLQLVDVSFVRIFLTRNT